MLAALPVVGLALGGALGAHPIGLLLGSAVGRALCLAGIVFDAVGLMWVQRFAARAERSG